MIPAERGSVGSLSGVGPSARDAQFGLRSRLPVGETGPCGGRTSTGNRDPDAGTQCLSGRRAWSDDVDDRARRSQVRGLRIEAGGAEWGDDPDVSVASRDVGVGGHPAPPARVARTDTCSRPPRRHVTRTRTPRRPFSNHRRYRRRQRPGALVATRGSGQVPLPRRHSGPLSPSRTASLERPSMTRPRPRTRRTTPSFKHGASGRRCATQPGSSRELGWHRSPRPRQDQPRREPGVLATSRRPRIRDDQSSNAQRVGR